MDLLKAALNTKRQSLENKELVGPKKKYFKREELLKKEEEEYWEKSSEKLRASINNENQFTNKGLGLSSNLDNVDDMLPRKEVIKRLRERGEPILLFGESISEAFLRLKQIQISESETNRGFRNDFQEAMEKLEQEYLNEMLKSKNSGNESKQKGNDVKVEDVNTTIEELNNLAINLRKRKDDISQDCKIICKFLKFLLGLWGKNLNQDKTKIKLPLKVKENQQHILRHKPTSSRFSNSWMVIK